MRRDRKTLLITPSFPPAVSGAASYFSQLSIELDRQGHGVIVLTTKPEKTIQSAIKVPIYRWLPIPRFANIRKIVWVVGTLLSIIWLRLRYGIDVIHVHSSTAIALGAMIASTCLRCPIVYEVQDMMAIPWLIRRGFQPRYVATGDTISRQLQSLGIASHDILTITSIPPRNIDLALMRGPQPEILDTFLFVGEIRNEIKGLDVLLRAFAQVRQTLGTATLNIIGGGPDRDYNERLAQELGIATDVHWIGPLPHDQVIEFMKKMHIMVVPSHSEGVPRVILEAMSCGEPIIASRVGGIPDVVTHGQTGILVPAGDARELSRAMTLVSRDRSLRERLCTAAERWLRSVPNWETLTRQILRLYGY